MFIEALLLAAVPALTDCNQNGIDDAVEIAKGITADCQGNGIPDECERGGVEPLAYWRFEEAGGELVEDLGPYGLDGSTLDTIVSDEIGYPIIPQTGAVNLRGRTVAGDGSILVADPEGLLSFGGEAFTIEAWVRIEQLSNTNGPNQRQTLVQKKPISSGGSEIDYLVFAQAGDATLNANGPRYGKTDGLTGREIAVVFGTGGGSSPTWIVTSSLEIEDHDWHHISVSLAGGDDRRIRFSLDGDVSMVSFDDIGHTTSEGPLLIGAHTNASGVYNQFLRGDVDELRICDRYLPDELLLADFRGGDCNGNGVPDGCEIEAGDATDCDGDGQPDSCQIDGNDCDGNGIPDQCDPDCNGNGIPDACDIASATSLDCQPDGIPDECQVEGGVRVGYDETGFAYIAIRSDLPYMVWMQRCNAPAANSVVDAIEVDFGIAPPNAAVTACIWSDPDADGDPRDAQLLWSLDGTIGDQEGLVTIDTPGIPVGDRNASFFVGFSMIVNLDPVDGDFPASMDIFGDPAPGRAWMIGSSSPIDLNDVSAFSEEYDLVEDRYFAGNWLIRARTSNPGIDCNGNGIPDDCDIAEGTSPDLDGDGRPDECGDCNANGVLDGFEIADGMLTDCDGDGIPDECQSTSNDCDGDGAPDSCQLAAGGDCNGNGILDACDIASGYANDTNKNLIPDTCEDCNGNGIIDEDDILLGRSADCDLDGIPDECQFGTPETTRIYADHDGTAESYINLIGASGYAWGVRHIIEPGGEWISAVELNWGLAWPGEVAKVAVWKDPNGDGLPDDAELLVEVETLTTEVYSDTFVRVPIPPTRVGDAGQSFLVGAWYTHPYGGSAMTLDYSDPAPSDSWFVAAVDGQILDLANLSSGFVYPFPGANFLISGVAHDGTTFPGDCNVNGLLDACDLDSDGDGIPDDCEPQCEGDLDANGIVDGSDVGLFFASWGLCPGDCPADFNGDGIVDGIDLGVVLESWGPCF